MSTPRENYRGPGFYRHYKGGEYEVICLALEETTKEPVVVYRPLAGWPEDVPDADAWTRPLGVFNEMVSDGVPRFLKLERPARLIPRSVPVPAPSGLPLVGAGGVVRGGDH